MNQKIYFDKKLLSGNKNYNIIFDIKNNTNKKLKQLYLRIEVMSNKDIFFVDKKIITNSHPLKPNSILQQVKIDLPQEFEQLKNNSTIKFYVKKRVDAPWFLVKIFTL